MSGNDLGNDTLVFSGSEEPTIGVELELPIIDRDTGELAPGAPRILAACAEDGLEHVSAELMQSMIEVRTPVCTTAMEVRDDLRARILRVRNIARSLGYELVMWGSHPFARPTAHSVSDNERYIAVEQRLAWMTSQRVTFGLHVHVGVRDGDEAVGVINMLVQYLPHLLALSVNSPFWQGVDTGFASARAILAGLGPHAGVPGHFENWRELREYLETMRMGGLLKSHKELKWDIRPRPDFGTVEFRVCDAPDRLGTAAGIAALARALVVSTQRLLGERPEARKGDVRRQWFAAENKWLAARNGLDAVYIRPSGGKRPLRQALVDLIDRHAPIVEAVDAPLLAALRAGALEESGAARQRRRYREAGEWRSLAQDAVQRLAQDVERVKASPPGPPQDQRVAGHV